MKKQSLRQLAKELGVSHAYLSQVKHGKRPLSAEVVSKMVSKNLTEEGFEPSVMEPKRDVFRRNSCYNLPVTGESSSGRTADSGSVSEGSNPSSPAIIAVAHSSSG